MFNAALVVAQQQLYQQQQIQDQLHHQVQPQTHNKLQYQQLQDQRDQHQVSRYRYICTRSSIML